MPYLQETFLHLDDRNDSDDSNDSVGSVDKNDVYDSGKSQGTDVEPDVAVEIMVLVMIMMMKYLKPESFVIIEPDNYDND